MIIFEGKKSGRVVTVALIFAAIAQWFYFYPILPDQIISHFNLTMQPDRWSSKNAVMSLHLGLVFGFALLFHFMAWCIGKIPTSWINLPEKNYWLSAERKTQSIHSLSTFFIWLGNVILIFIVVMFHLSYQANLSPVPKTNNFLAALGLFLMTIGFMIYHLFKRFHTKGRSQ